MYTLVTAKSRFYRFRRGQSAADIESVLSVPCGEVFCGAIVPIVGEYIVYSVKPCETYKSIAGKFGIDEKLLKSINFSRPLYPTQKLFIRQYVGS